MFIQAFGSTENQAGTPTFNANVPGAANGNLILAFQMTALGLVGVAPAVPTGWLLQDRQAAAGIDLACYYRVASSEPATYPFNNGSGVGAKSHVWMVSIVGAASAPESNTKATGTGTTATVGSITTLTANEYIFGAFGIATNIGETITPNGFNSSPGTLNATECKLNLAEVSQASIGATGAKTATISGSMLWLALLVAVPGAPSDNGGGGGSAIGHFHKLRTTGGWILKKRVGRKLR